MEKISKANIKLERSNCSFAERSIKFLGFGLSSIGLSLDEDKVTAITKMTIPKTVRAVRIILCSTGFYRRHILNYSKLCEPLIELTKNTQNDSGCLKKITSTPQCNQAFELLKKAVVNTPILHNPFWMEIIGSIVTQA